ncbi:MAG: hypothetical protein J6D31_02175 [Clostridia bacterium]|nr:hypothetical protein [Clostridia bacterium]
MVIEELRYTPRPANRRAVALAIGLSLPAVLLFAVSAAMPNYGGVMQLLGLVMLVVGLFVAYKFILSSYTYVLTDPGDGTPYLLIEQTQGKRVSLVCRVPLEQILRISETEKGHRGGKAYVYVATMHGGRYQYVSGRAEGVDLLLKLEADEGFLAALRRESAAARAAAVKEE